MWTWLSTVALAAPVHGMVEVRMEGVVAEPDGADVSGLGGGLGVGVQAKGPLWVELTADLTAPVGGPGRLGLGADLRLFVLRRDGVPMALSLVGGGGYNLKLADAEIPAGFVRAGVAVDLRPTPVFGVRVSGAWLPMVESGRAMVHGAELGVGLVFTPGKAAPPAEPPPPPPPVAPPPAAARTWLAYPECRWSTAEVGAASISAFEEKHRGGTSDEPAEDPASPRAKVGGLVVGACGGDQVWVGEREVETDRAGIAEVYDLPSGFLDLRVIGGGREAPRRLGFTRGQALWVAVDCPVDAVVYFDLGSAVVSERSAAEIARWASLAGDWRVELRGSYSPEGDAAANEVLAMSRAAAVQAALVAAGLPAERVVVGAAVPPDALVVETPDLLRRVTLRWLSPGEAP
jgi:outer membrane protein OmpA-like peptidoglycan-associated protein